MVHPLAIYISSENGVHVVEADLGDWEMTIHLRPLRKEVSPDLAAMIKSVGEALLHEDRHEMPWTDAEDAALVRGFDAWRNIGEVASHLGRTPDMVRRRLEFFGRLPALDPVTGLTIGGDASAQ